MGSIVKKVTKPLGGIGGVLSGGLLGGMGPLGIFGAGGLAGLLGSGTLDKDMLFGKKDEGTPDRYVDLDPSLQQNTELARKAQRDAMKSQQRVFSQGEGKRIAGLERQIGEQTASRAFDDRQRRLSDLVRQRGLANTSLGITQELGAAKERDEAIQQARLAEPLRKLQLQQQFAQQRQNAAQSAIQAPGLQRTFIPGRQATGQRAGGLVDILGTVGGGVAGGLAGGPAGIGAGASAGGGLGSMLGGFFG